MVEPHRTSKRVLVYVGQDLIGDAVMKLPFVRALRAGFPDGELIWLAGTGPSAFRDALSPLTTTLLDAVIDNAEIGHNAWQLFARPLPSQHFDLIIDTQRRFLTSLIVKRIRHDCFISGAGDFILSDIKPPGPYQRPPGMVTQMMDLLELALGHPPQELAALHFSAEITTLAKALLPPGYIYVAIAPGAGGKIKIWPLDNFVKVAQALVRAGRVPVFLLGPEEAVWYGNLAAAVPTALFPLQQRGAKPFSPRVDLTIALAARCRAGLANDSGGGHLIAAAGIPMVSLYGPTDPAKFAPATPRLTVIEARSFGGVDMALIPVAHVLSALEPYFA